MGPSRITVEMYINPLSDTLEYVFDLPYPAIEKMARTFLVNDVFALV